MCIRDPLCHAHFDIDAVERLDLVLRLLDRAFHALRVDPGEFGFVGGTTIVVVDLSRIGRPDTLKQISTTPQRCGGGGEVRWHPRKPLIGINTAVKESEIQYLINSSTRMPLKCVWSHVQSARVLVVPVIGTP
jgi:hypothetical protein